MHARRSLVLLASASLAGCAGVPRVDGVPADQLPPAPVIAAARTAYDAGDDARAADLAEHLLRSRFEFAGQAEARRLAADARFRAGDLDQAFLHYRRLLDEDPLGARGPELARRVFAIGKTLAEEPGGWFGDLGSRHDVGIEALNLLVTRFPGSPVADDGWKTLGEAFMTDGLHVAAADVWERLARDHPESEWTDLALYRVAEAYRRQSRGSAFDVEPLLRAHAALTRYLERFPDGNFVAAARAERAALEAEVARHELGVAAFYARRGEEQGRRLHLANAAVRFPGALPAGAPAPAVEADASAATAGAADLLEPRQDRPPWRRAPVSAGVGAGGR